MNIDVARAGKAPRKLRELLKSLSPDPDPETVHELRTQTRRLEAVLHILSPRSSGPADPQEEDSTILKLMKPIRRAAGRVRDMDVLIENISRLSSRAQSDGVARLIDHMSAIRTAYARRLHRRVKRHRREARSSLKRLLGRLQAPDHTRVSGALASSQILARKLEHWPRLTEQNLHEFRKGVKELHYMLQLDAEQSDQRMASYTKVKDTVGDWHDWMELKGISESILDPKDDAPVLREIRGVLQQKLHTALNAANSLRKKGIEMRHAA